MICDDLREWIDLLGREGELVEVTAEVDPHLEITEIADRVIKAGGPALLFRNVRGSALPLLINQFGTERRMCLAFGVERLDELGDKSPRCSSCSRRRAWATSCARSASSSRSPTRAPKTVSSGAVPGGRAGASPTSTALPILTCWPDDGGPFITLPLGLHEGPAHRRAQRRHVPHAEVRRDLDGPALADPQGRRRRLARRRRAAWRSRSRSAPIPITTYAGSLPRAQAHRRADVRRLPARQPRRARAVQDRRPAGARARGDRARGLLRARRAAPTRGRSATTPATTRPPRSSRCSTLTA